MRKTNTSNYNYTFYDHAIFVTSKLTGELKMIMRKCGDKLIIKSDVNYEIDNSKSIEEIYNGLVKA